MSFEQSVIQNVSRACAPLAAWVKANVKYSEALLKIEPLTNELNGLMQKLEKSQYRMAECQRNLEELDGSVATLNDNFARKTQEAESLKFGLKKAEETLQAAQSLLGQLSGENERWRKQIGTLEQEMALVPSKSLLSAAYITYLGQANESVREKVLHEWLSMMRMTEFNFRSFLSTESQLLTWKKEGLPADTLSMENAIMILNTNRTPLIIDPAT
jgi:dynein heavy chain 2, cytosolic